MKKIMMKIYHQTLIGRVFMHIYHFFINHLIPDKIYIPYKYKKVFGVKPNLKNPVSLNEKIIWSKLNDRSLLFTKCADKYAVREYIIDKIGDEYLVPLLFQTYSSSEINENTINTVPCIIKTNHDSGGGIFVYDKAIVDWAAVRKKLDERMSKNYYTTSREWQYKNIKPCIIVEKLLQDSDGNIPFDYKLHCFNGKVQMIQVDLGRETDNHCRNWYSTEWKREPYKWSSKKGDNKYTDPSTEDIEKPKNLKKMIELSELLSEDFDYVRVDWYDVNNKLYFGELTFHHDGGYRPIEPKEWDMKLGQMLKLTAIEKR